MNFKLTNSYLLDSFVIGGKLEGKGPITGYLDYINAFEDTTFESNEIDSMISSIDHLLEKTNLECKDIDLAISGELSNQLTTTNYTYRTLLIPLIGIYSACSSIALGLGLASLLLDNKSISKILVTTSSNTESAEREFRNPNEYGGEKLNTQTYTSTIAASAIITNTPTNIRFTSFTIGKVIDIGFTDPYDFGRAMAPAAIETLLEHFKETKTEPKDYDLVLTGDLSKYGYEIVLSVLNQHFANVTNYNDCGLVLYDINTQNVFAGGSGPGTSAGVLLAYIKKKIENKELKKVLLCATGALLSPTMILQKNSIPCIAHCIVMEAA